ncbi:MAG: 16S rRNA (guanine(966)-N(2))-methyltransferase RsmD [Thermodesulfobacteriota bacterium]
MIAGSARGRRLCGPAGADIRPTADRAKEALFSILGDRVEGARVLDLFAGSGALGIEALSRGGGFAVFVDRQQASLTLVRRNLDLCRLQSRALVLQRDLERGAGFVAGLGQSPFDIVFCDPPYGRQWGEKVLAWFADGVLLSAEGVLVIEERSGEKLPEACGRLGLTDQRRYGDSSFWFYRRSPAEIPSGDP